MPTENISRAFASTRAVLVNVTPGQLGDPTPCDAWTVRDLINHIVTGAHWFGATTELGKSAPVPKHDWTAGDAVGDFDRGVARTVASFEVPGALERTIALPFGDFPGGVHMNLAATDTFTHGWDLARATGQSTDLDPELAAQLLIAVESVLSDRLRGDEPRPFGLRVEPAVGATAADRLAAFLGRRP